MEPLFTVDGDKCKRDGLCQAECPMALIFLEDRKSLPTPVPGAEDVCINCGHCVAICPHGALSLRTMPLEDCPPIRHELAVSPDQVSQLLRGRRSIRVYKSQPVPRDLLRRLIELARYAPSGKNVQPVQWKVFMERARIQELSGLVVDWMRNVIKENPKLAEMLNLELVVRRWEKGHDTICRESPHLIVTHAHKNERTAPQACTLALGYLELAAPSMGLGACWAGYFNTAANLWPPLLEALGLPEGHITYGCMMVGFPSFTYHRLPLRAEPVITWQ